MTDVTYGWSGNARHGTGTRFFVPGTPTPKGSWSAIWNPHVQRGRHKGGCILVAQNSTAAKAWAKAIKVLARAAKLPREMSGPVGIDILFWLHRAEATNIDWRFRDITPDVDKLERAVLDALTGIAWADDRQVCDAHAIKRYVTEDLETGADITIWPMTQAETLFDAG